MSDDSTFSFQEVRVLLTHFGSWLLNEHGLTLLSPALTVDRYLEHVGATDGDEPQIVKTKQFSLNPPMNAEEAVLQLELVGHDFFVFRNVESGDVNVVYRRRDGGYGLIEPQ